MEMERKEALAEIKELDEKGAGILRFITHEQEDKDGDVTRKGFIGRQGAHLLPNHNWKSDAPPLGDGESFEDETGTYFRFQLNLDTTLGREWRNHLKFAQRRGNGRSLQQVSYGFSPFSDGQERGQKDGRSIRYLKPRPDGSPGAKLHEVSFVIVGAGVNTEVLDVKSLDAFLTEEEKQEGAQIQTLIFKKSKWESAEAVRSWCRSHDFKSQLAEFDDTWHAEQRDSGDFARLRSWCVNPSRQSSADACRVMARGGPIKESRGVEPEQSPQIPQETAVPPAQTAKSDTDDWTQYAEDRRPPLPVMIKWARMYLYHMQFLRDIRKKDGKEISAETISEFTELVQAYLNLGTQMNIKVMTANLLPNVEETILQQERYKERHKELTHEVNKETEQKYQALQARAAQLEQESRVRSSRMREWSNA
jgi:phage head maturation protease